MDKGQIFQIQIGNLMTWMGELQTIKKEDEAVWWRIKNPCRVLVTKDNAIGLMAIQQSGDFYEKYVDIRIPDEAVVFICEVNKDSELYGNYLKESSRKKSTIIQTPGIMPATKLKNVH